MCAVFDANKLFLIDARHIRERGRGRTGRINKTRPFWPHASGFPFYVLLHVLFGRALLLRNIFSDET